jgi:tetratricopeptide (TPR) repeat protein
MMTQMAVDTPPPGPERGQAPRSFYHKEKPVPRSRDGVSPADPVDDATPSRRSSTNPGWELMLANLRRFGAFMGGMVLLLLVSILVLKFLWGVRDRELHSPQIRPPPFVAATNESPVMTDTQLLAAARQGTTELDTELVRRAVFMAKHGQTLVENQKYDEAIVRYREALDIWPYLTSVWGQLGKLYLRTREFGQVPRSRSRRRSRTTPAPPNCSTTWAWRSSTRASVDKATHLFEAAVEVDPDYAASHFNIALCHLTRNDRVSARGSLERFLRMKPHDARALRENGLPQRDGDALPGPPSRSLQQALQRSTRLAPALLRRGRRRQPS